MLKALSLSLVATFILLLTPVIVQAKMMYYTFEGIYTHERIDVDQNAADPQAVIDAIVPDELFRRGEFASYTFGIDMDRPGVARDQAGNLNNYPNSEYMEYMGGTALSGFNTHLSGVHQQFYDKQFGLVGIAVNGHLISGTLPSLTVGVQEIFGENYSTFEAGLPEEGDYSAVLYVSMQLISISPVNPYATTTTPIPGAIWLFGPGLVVMAGLRRKFTK